MLMHPKGTTNEPPAQNGVDNGPSQMYDGPAQGVIKQPSSLTPGRGRPMAYSNLWPRLASVNAARNATQANTFARYQCLIATRRLAYNGGSDGVQAIKQVNAGCTILAYVPITIQDLSDYDTANKWFSTVNLPGGGVAGLVVDPQWWLGVAPAPGLGAVGTTFSSWPLGGTGTGAVTVNSTLALQPPYGPALGTSTVMLIDTGANTEIVLAHVVDSTTVMIEQRLQYYGGYPMGGIDHSMSPTPFIRIMAYQFANAALFNCSLFSAVSPVDNKTYGQRLGAYMGQVLSTSSSWDGIHGDNAVLSYYASGSGNLSNQALDANNDNVGDGGDGGLLGYGWRDGMASAGGGDERGGAADHAAGVPGGHAGAGDAGAAAGGDGGCPATSQGGAGDLGTHGQHKRRTERSDRDPAGGWTCAGGRGFRGDRGHSQRRDL